jgi:glutaconate CoA-transferase subunit B
VPRTRLPGAGGAPEIATAAREVAIILKHSKRTFVEKLDFVTSSGYFENENGNSHSQKRGRGPTTVISDLGIIVSDPATNELVLTSMHLGVTVEQVKAATGWPLKVASHVDVTPAPTTPELAALRDLHARTTAAHGGAASSE